jgi:hypothetical protein
MRELGGKDRLPGLGGAHFDGAGTEMDLPLTVTYSGALKTLVWTDIKVEEVNFDGRCGPATNRIPVPAIRTAPGLFFLPHFHPASAKSD